MPPAMTNQPRSTIIEDNPIGNGLDAVRASFNTVCTDALGQLDQEALRKLTRAFLRAAQNLPAADLLPATIRRGTLRSDLLRLELSLDSDDFDLDRIKPVLDAALADHLDDTLVWNRIYNAVTESQSTPPPRPIASSFQQTPWLRNTSSFANSSEHREYIDNVLKEELGPIYIGLQDLYKTYFGDIPNLENASETFFEQNCLGGSNPLFSGQDDVLSWFVVFTEKLAAFAESCDSAPAHKRRPLAKPNKPIAGSVGKRKMDIGFMDDDSGYHWSQILVPGELKSNPSADRPSEARLDLGRYAREVLAAQDTRRFVFDRLGGVASEQFDINKDGLRFVSTILGFLWMSKEELGFDLTITTAEGQRFIEITQGGSKERLILDGTMKRARCIAGRATTCWKAYRQDDPHALFVIKDSWQYLEREEEGKFLREATDKGVVYIARHYHYETVQVQGIDNDVRSNVRKGTNTTGLLSIAGAKRSSYETGAFLPPSKRPCSTSPTKASSNGIPIYKAGSRATLLTALADCIEGYESLRQEASLLHRDISIGNLLVSKDNGRFLIDLDLAIKEQRVSALGAKGKTGTRAFIAIRALLGEQHSFIHDLESFFWVLFWICIHYDGPVEGTVELARLKKGEISNEGDFIKVAEENFTPYYKSMVPWVNRLRKAVFPNGRR
ncbi:hypothetical protein BT67DRAFT_461555 [Trichocladium antarcticum]|uniref:non-specific serine/threonine protein kinase n=1 Tax=Trichocladium antarcticum TaxID=1450529 RepID=A0AAN6UND0_9PEZI|nr:hypothetical protein BT67DRAFT_461555 [Trichocladium antarcticum]